MDKIYLKYDDVKPCVECDFGFVSSMVLIGCMYPYKKGDFKYFVIMLALQLSICTLVFILMPVDIIYKFIFCIIMIFVINLLFAFNYNMMVIERLLKEGYYPMDYDSSDKLIKKGI